MPCSKLHCQKGFNFILFSYKIANLLSRATRRDSAHQKTKTVMMGRTGRPGNNQTYCRVPERSICLCARYPCTLWVVRVGGQGTNSVDVLNHFGRKFLGVPLSLRGRI